MTGPYGKFIFIFRRNRLQLVVFLKLLHLSQLLHLCMEVPYCPFTACWVGSDVTSFLTILIICIFSSDLVNLVRRLSPRLIFLKYKNMHSLFSNGFSVSILWPSALPLLSLPSTFVRKNVYFAVLGVVFYISKLGQVALLCSNLSYP